ncbi:MAG: GatB/YqeY domain-containing protein [Dehalococcoidia bacterium]|nr:GatB/YqeY domain-containing protein [Dehalococcoidia bacterium]
MATLSETIRSQMLDATRARDNVRRDTLRLLVAAVENGRIDAGHDLSDDETLRVLQKEAKQRRESIVEYRKGNREDLVQQEQQELEIIETYLPAQLSDDEVRELVEETIAEAGASGPDDLKLVMGPLMKKLEGRADGRVANAIVRELLSD